ncbi:hypothetical protein LLR47_20100 [Bacillus cereus]|uniref:hypothetical protein n=1 Tax=Bacillus cereus TaxID=1396 RepID=UPI001D1333DB|nr:hypothetical protein [Bacillus cereus]MCC3687510.1 hypothetical protein [Bacillus cereus]
MNLNLEKTRQSNMVMKGDILVFQSRTGRTMYYLVIEDVPRSKYLLLNLEGNNLMSLVETSHVSQILDIAKKRFRKLDFIKVIPAEEFELKRI